LVRCLWPQWRSSKLGVASRSAGEPRVRSGSGALPGPRLDRANAGAGGRFFELLQSPRPGPGTDALGAED
jgi:hypothetical protein